MTLDEAIEILDKVCICECSQTLPDTEKYTEAILLIKQYIMYQKIKAKENDANEIAKIIGETWKGKK